VQLNNVAEDGVGDKADRHITANAKELSEMTSIPPMIASRTAIAKP
jgi:hypothetical protein